jgi:5-methylcytosine-specific restriction endonuclease McrA
MWGMGRKIQTRALYGNIGLDKGFCPTCKNESFIVSDNFVCCGEKVDLETRTVKRESEPQFKRCRLSEAEKDALVSHQDYACFYCGRSFGSLVWRKRRSLRLKVEIDHLIPHSYAANQETSNLVAACHICNSIKSSLMFQTLEEAQVYLLDKWKTKGYYD